MKLDGRSASSFGTFWPRFERACKQSEIGAALRRFSYGGERSRKDDAIVDHVAALEGLLLSDVAEGEYRYRTSLRGAFVIKRRGYSRTEVQRQLGRAYDARSAVAHGKQPRASTLRLKDGTKVDIEAFANETEALIRDAMKYAIDFVAAGGTWPPDWDAKILRSPK
jgi:hypothetical protein